MFTFENHTFYFGKHPARKTVFDITSHSVNRMTSSFEHSYYLGDAHLLSHTICFKTILLLQDPPTVFRKQVSTFPLSFYWLLFPGGITAAY